MKDARNLGIASLLLAWVLIGCTERGTAPSPGAATAVTDQWLGQWNGPEGTFLRIEGGTGKYQVIIQDLDGPQSYPGRAEGDRILFERKGVEESISATNGAETGMKWLSEKSNCLTVKPGEGYCRD